MRLLNSICKVIQDTYENIPVNIAAIPADVNKPCFYVSLITESYNVQNRNSYQTLPTYQIVYFGTKDEANLVHANELYKIKDELTGLFLLNLSIPIIPKEGVTEKQRYAKIDTFTNEIRLSEGALYTKLTLNFIEEIPKVDTYEQIKEVYVDTKFNQNN